MALPLWFFQRTRPSREVCKWLRNPWWGPGQRPHSRQPVSSGQGTRRGKARKQSQQSQPCSQCSLKIKREIFVEELTNLYAAFLGDECGLLHVIFFLANGGHLFIQQIVTFIFRKNKRQHEKTSVQNFFASFPSKFSLRTWEGWYLFVCW